VPSQTTQVSEYNIIEEKDVYAQIDYHLPGSQMNRANTVFVSKRNGIFRLKGMK